MVLCEQKDKNGTTTYLSGLLIRLSELYGIKDFQAENSVMMADWIMENYKFDRLDVVIGVLKNPPALEERVWRINPDTVQEWMSKGLEKQAEKAEAAHATVKFMPPPALSEIPEKYLTQMQEEIAKSPDRKVPQITKQEAREQGQERPPKTKGSSYIPDPSLIDRKKDHIQWIRENFDAKTGNKKPGWISETEWLKRQSKP